MTYHANSLGMILLALIGSPFLLGVINRTKAWFGGRKGQPLFQVYYDMAKLLRKGAVYSTTTSWIFRFGPVLGFSAVAASLLVLPMFGSPSLLSFSGDFLLFIYLFALARFFTILTAMDTGSSFEGMGASREAIFSTLTEPALFLALGALVKHSKSMVLSDIFNPTNPLEIVPMLLISFGLMVVILTENCRIPVDDPNTHLELTMIHEVMVLDNSGPDLALITYAASLKLWITTSILAQLILDQIPDILLWSRFFMVLLTMLLLMVVVGIIESSMARLRISQVPKLLIGASMMALFGFMIAR